jgi:Family of unknown function (DUF6088)
VPQLELTLGASRGDPLSRLVKTGEIQRLGRGLCHCPRVNERMGSPIGPNPDEIADALGRQTASRVLPSGAVATNQLGLSTQVFLPVLFLASAALVVLACERSRRLTRGSPNR